MGQVNMNGKLKDYINTHYPETKSDLMTVFMEVIPNMTLDNSRFALINLPSWLFLSSFEKLRESYIKNYHFESLLHMGRGIFGIDFGSVAFSIKKDQEENAVGSYFRLHERNFQHILYEDIEKLFLYSNGNINYKYDFKLYRGEEGITEIPKEGTENGQRLFYPNLPQSNFNKIPGYPIAYWASNKVINMFEKALLLGEVEFTKKGADTGDNNKFLRHWHEVNHKKIDKKIKWVFYNKGGNFRKWYGNFEYVINWEHDGMELKATSANLRSSHLYFIESLSWNALSAGAFSIRYSDYETIFDSAGSSMFIKSAVHDFKEYLGFLNSNVAQLFLNIINPTLNYGAGTVGKLPVNKSNWQSSSKYVNENIKISKNDWNSHEISWCFENSPLLNNSKSLNRAFQKFQNHASEEFFQLQINEEKLNQIFIELYSLNNELIPKVALKDITILQEELSKKDLEKLEPVFREKGAEGIELPINKSEVISQFISYTIGLFMGRYRLDKPGLNIAHPNPTKEELAIYKYNNGEVIIDQDAILPLMGKNCNFSDDVVKKFNQLLDTIWGHDQRTENINFIQECLNKDIEKFLVNDFWSYHCGMYKKTPIYWLFSSKKGAFQVLVYMHRMNEFTVEKIRANYLLEHLKFLKSEIAQKEANESRLSTAEAKQLDKLRADLSECEQYDLVLKNVADKQIKFDLDDGVAKNYELFKSVVAKIK